MKHFVCFEGITTELVCFELFVQIEFTWKQRKKPCFTGLHFYRGNVIESGLNGIIAKRGGWSPLERKWKKKEMKHDSHLHRTKPRVVRGGREEAKVVPRSDGQFGGRHAVKVGQNHQDPFEDQRLLTLATSQRENLRRENNPLGQLETNSPTSFSKLKVMSCISDSFIRLSMVVFLDCWGFHTCLILFFN